jgi:hypothetical protein
MNDREHELQLINSELKQKKEETIRNMEYQAMAEMQQLEQERKSEQEDELHEDLMELRLAKDTNLRYLKEQMY